MDDRADLARGLDEAEAAGRLGREGPNEVAERPEHPIRRFLSKFWGLTAWMLEATIVLTLVLHKDLDAAIVAVLLVLNAILGFAQEQRAAGAVASLRERLQVTARVLRSGTWRTVPARELVPGDVVRVRAGDVVPADLRVAAGTVDVDQSALTGESVAVAAGSGAPAYSASVVRRGEATGVVTATGPRTFYGRTAELVQLARPKLHMEEVVARVVRWLLAIVGVMIAIALAASLVRGQDLGTTLPLLVVLLFSAIPVALPAMFTTSMALGSLELAARGVLVTRLSASEDAAGMDVLCADKTGTLTVNRLTVSRIAPLPGFTEDEVVAWGALASERANLDPIDLAFLDAAAARGLGLDAYTVTAFSPFDPATRRTEATVTRDGRAYRSVKGSVGAVAAACGLDAEGTAALERGAEDDARRGLRTLAVAVADGPGALRPAGLVALLDPPRSDSAALIAELRSLGVQVRMLTGDAAPIAAETAAGLGLGGRILRGERLRAAGTDQDLARLVEEADGFAEIYPEDKYRIVGALQHQGHVVGMTGDGVNDAPALRQAEVGIAVPAATDTAKGAASVVLTAEGLTAIVDLVKTGRMIFQRIVTWILNKVVKTFQIAVFVVVGFLVTGRYVVTTFDMVLLLLLVDFVTLSLATDTVRWSPGPDRWDITGLVAVGIGIGVLALLESLALLWLGVARFHLLADPARLHTLGLETLFFFGIFTVFVVRERGRFWRTRPSTSLLVASAADVVILVALVTVGMPRVAPVPLPQTLAILAYAAVCSFALNDAAKVRLLRGRGGPVEGSR